MPNNNNYVAFEFNDEIKQEYFTISQEISTQIENFVPFELDQIHMTVCFLGELGKKLKNNYKQSINQINEKLQNFDIINSIEFSHYELFGTKNNLIVAIFKISNSEKNKLIELKKDFANKYDAPKEDFYVPHITLGKIQFYDSTKPFDIKKLLLNKPNHLKLTNLKMKFV